MSKITIERSVVEQALEMLNRINAADEDRDFLTEDEAVCTIMAIDELDAALRAALEQPQVEREPSSTAGMNIAQRILHVGGRNNAAGYVEFGSVQAVEALVRQVLRDLPQQHEPLGEQEPMAWLHTDRLGGKQAFTNEPPPGLKAKCQPLVCAPQPQDDQEPVAFVRRRVADDFSIRLKLVVTAEDFAGDTKQFLAWCEAHADRDWTPLYTHPQPKREPLTDEEIRDLFQNQKALPRLKKFIRVIEKAHGIGKQE